MGSKFELVVPAYNEALNIPGIIRRAVKSARDAGLTASDFSLIVVQNGSTDHSDEVLKDLHQVPDLGSWFRVVKVEKNQGYGHGLWQGLCASSSPIIGWSHADQQCDPGDAIKAFRILEQECDAKTLVKGERYDRNARDRFVSRNFEIFARIILGVKLHEINAQPKVFYRSLLSTMKNPPNTFAFDLYLLYQATKANFVIKAIPVSFPPRIHGVSNWASNFASRYKTILAMMRYMLHLRIREGRTKVEKY